MTRRSPTTPPPPRLTEPHQPLQDGPNWRPMAIEEGGKSQFPYMRDPNTGKKMYESDDIIRYIVRAPPPPPPPP